LILHSRLSNAACDSIRMRRFQTQHQLSKVQAQRDDGGRYACMLGHYLEVYGITRDGLPGSTS
jgi:hypothetical protein